MAGIGELSVFVTANTGKALAKLSGFRKSLSKTADFAKKTASSLGRIGKGAALAGVGSLTVAMAGLVSVTKQALSNIDDLAKTADKLGVGTEALAGMRLAAEEAGLSVQSMDKSLQFMIRNISEASVGRGTAVGPLAELGLDVQKLNKMKPEEQLRKITESFQGIQNHADKVRIAINLFGREGASMINLMKNGPGVLDDTAKAAKELGLAVNRFDAAQVESANDALGRVWKSLEGVGNVLAVKVAPLIEMMSKSFTGWLRSAGGMEAKMNSFGKLMQKVAGFVLDMGEMIKIAFMGIQWAITKMIAVAANGIDKVAEMAQKLAKATGIGENIANGLRNGTRSVAGAFDAQVDELGEKLQDAWLAPPPSSKLQAWTDSVAAAAEESRKKYNDDMAATEQAKKNATALQGVSNLISGAKSIGRMIADGFSKNAVVSQIEPAALQSVVAGTAEEYALRASMTNSAADARKEQVDATNANTDAVEQLTTGLADVADTLASRVSSVTGFIGI